MPKARAREAKKLKRPQTQSSRARAHPAGTPPPFRPFALLAINELLPSAGGITNISKSQTPTSKTAKLDLQKQEERSTVAKQQKTTDALRRGSHGK